MGLKHFPMEIDGNPVPATEVADRIVVSVTWKDRRAFSDNDLDEELERVASESLLPETPGERFRSEFVDGVAQEFANARGIAENLIGEFNSISGQSIGSGTFRVEASTPVGCSLSGHRNDIEATFDVELDVISIGGDRDSPPRRIGWTVREMGTGDLTLPVDLVGEWGDRISSIRLAAPASFDQTTITPPQPTPTPSKHSILNLDDEMAILGIPETHVEGVRGSGVRITSCDSGILDRYQETVTLIKNAGSDAVFAELSTEAAVLLSTAVGGVEHSDTFIETVDPSRIRFPSASPRDTAVVEYSGLHPYHGSSNHKDIYVIPMPGEDPLSDVEGHGTLTSAELIAAAPEAELVAICGAGLAAFRKGMELFLDAKKTDPELLHVMSCSWGMRMDGSEASQREYFDLLEEIRIAQQLDTCVVFSAGNVYIDHDAGPDWVARSDAGTNRKSIGSRHAMVVGGANPDGSTFVASDYASSFDSHYFDGRHVPDVVGLVGMKNQAFLTTLPTKAGGRYDTLRNRKKDFGGNVGLFESDGTGSDDGWLVVSGTSTATPQVAGIAALLRSVYPSLAPHGVRNVLEESARPVLHGSSASGQTAWSAYHSDATGYGVVHAPAAVGWLDPELVYLRCCLPDTQDHSPDIIVREKEDRRPNTELGRAKKHVEDLSESVPAVDGNWVYVRLMNQGPKSRFDCSVEVTLVPTGGTEKPRVIATLKDLGIGAGDFAVFGSPWDASGIKPGDYRLEATVSCGSPSLPISAPPKKCPHTGPPSHLLKILP